MEGLVTELRARLRETPARPLPAARAELREASVLVPLLVRDGVAHLLLTRRTKTLRAHAGQGASTLIV